MILAIFMSEKQKRILLTNGRSPMTLYLARLLNSAGHEVFVTDPQKIHYCRFSNCVKKNFKVPSPRFKPKAHVDALKTIVKEQKIDLLIPTWEDVLLISKHKDEFDPHCKLYVDDFDLLLKVHNKWSFINFLDEMGFETPKTQIIRSKEDFENIDMDCFALKPGFSRSSKHVFKVRKGDPMPDIYPSEEEEWIAQEWLNGDIYCSYTLCENGKIYAHSLYPMEFIRDQGEKRNVSIGSYCLSFTSVEHEKIYKWTEEFVRKTHFTGQLAFDFFELANGQVYAFECNPRLTSGVTLFHPKDRIDKAYFAQDSKAVLAPKDSMTQIFFGMLFLGWQPALVCKKLTLYIKKLFNSKDIVFNWKDVKPFLFTPLIMLKVIYVSLANRSSIPSSFTDDLDYNGEKESVKIKA